MTVAELWVAFGREHRAYDEDGKGLQDLANDYVETLAAPEAVIEHEIQVRHARLVMIEEAIKELGGVVDVYAMVGRMAIYGPDRKVYARF
ncbi:hypothetical protein ACIA49_39210 [Kribbella sp. NPDC051587]|uniref:hypothetical protein n=1 Tax=Kribbella sp. NPDC051587 TaxID=3364119 RepID=UPI0037BB9743